MICWNPYIGDNLLKSIRIFNSGYNYKLEVHLYRVNLRLKVGVLYVSVVVGLLVKLIQRP
jgi:hypothetical protein